MAEEQNKPKPPKLKIIRTAKSVKLPKVKLSDSQARGNKDRTGRGDTSKKIPRVSDTSRKIPKVGVKSNPSSETTRIKLPPEIKDRGPATVLRRAKLAPEQPTVPEALSNKQQQNAEKSTTVRIEIDTAILRADKLKAKVETPQGATISMDDVQRDSEVVPAVDEKGETKASTSRIDPRTLEEQSKQIPAADSKSSQEVKSSTIQIDPTLLVDDSQEIAPVDVDEAKRSTASIDPKDIMDASQEIPTLDTKNPAVKGQTIKIDPAGIVDDSQEIPQILQDDKASTMKIDPTGVVEDSQKIDPSKKEDSRLKASTLPIDPAKIEDSQPIPELESKKPAAKSSTIQIDTSKIVDDSQEIKAQTEPEAPQENKASTQDIMKATTLPMDAEKLPIPEESAEPKSKKIKVPARTTKLKKVNPAATPEKKTEAPKAEEAPKPTEGLTALPEEKTEDKGNIFKATTMAMDSQDLSASLAGEEDVAPSKDIFKQVTQELKEPALDAPKTVRIKKPTAAIIPKTVKLKKGSSASDTSKVQVDGTSAEPKKTVKLKRAKAPESQAGSGLRIRSSDTDDSSSPELERIMDNELAPTGTDGPNIFMVAVSVLSLVTSSVAILYLWKALDLYKNF